MRLLEVLEQYGEEELCDVIAQVQRLEEMTEEEYLSPQSYALLCAMAEAMRMALDHPQPVPMEGLIAAYLEVGFELGVRWCTNRGKSLPQIREHEQHDLAYSA